VAMAALLLAGGHGYDGNSLAGGHLHGGPGLLFPVLTAGLAAFVAYSIRLAWHQVRDTGCAGRGRPGLAGAVEAVLGALSVTLMAAMAA
jgi:hypothetical protein